MGNGEEYDGKLRTGQYQRSVPGHTCGGVERELSLMSVKASSISLTNNISDNCDNTTSLSDPKLTYNEYNKDYLGYKWGIYKYNGSNNLASNQKSFTEMFEIGLELVE